MAAKRGRKEKAPQEKEENDIVEEEDLEISDDSDESDDSMGLEKEDDNDPDNYSEVCLNIKIHYDNAIFTFPIDSSRFCSGYTKRD